MRVAQVTARLGETIVDLAHVAPGDRYTIGTAPEARLAIGGLTDFPLVSSESRGFVVRRPVGLGTLAVDGQVREDAEVVVGWQRITFAIELAAIEISLVERAPVPVPRPPVDARPPAYIFGTLIFHLLVWAVALELYPAPPGKRPRPVKQAHPLLVHLGPLPPPPPPPPRPAPAPPAKAATRVAGALKARALGEVRMTGEAAAPTGKQGPADMGAAAAQVAEAMPDVRGALDGVGPVYVPSAVDNPFGDDAKMDPKTRPGFGAIEIHTGRYRTIGVNDPLVASQGLALCESRRCEVTGGLAKEALREVAATRGYELQQCMGPGEDPTELHRGAALLELDIAPDGRVAKVHGQGAAARCAATVLASLAFPPAEEATHATFTIGFP